MEDGEHYSLDDDEALVEGSLEGRGTAISIPLRRGIDDDGLVSVFAKIVSKVVVQRYQPAAVLARCSGSVLAENRASGFNVSEKGLARCAQEVFSWKRPTMFFGTQSPCFFIIIWLCDVFKVVRTDCVIWSVTYGLLPVCRWRWISGRELCPRLGRNDGGERAFVYAVQVNSFQRSMFWAVQTAIRTGNKNTSKCQYERKYSPVS